MTQSLRVPFASWSVILLILLAVSTEAADKPTLALVGGQVIDGYEGPPIKDGTVLIAGERILAVGPRDQIPVPPGTPVIDTNGMSVLPGLMDMHVHLMILGHADYEYWDKTYMDRFRDVIMPTAAKQLLMSGVTTVRDLGAPLDDIIAVRGDVLSTIELLRRIDVVVKNGERVK